MSKIIILGAGVIGLSIGWQLAREGQSVIIFERDYAGGVTSKAAAGMLAPYTEASLANSELFRLGEASLALYPQFLKELEHDAGHPLTPQPSGTLSIALNIDDTQWLRWQYDQRKKRDMPVIWLNRDQALQQEPLLSPQITAAMWIPTERQVDNHQLLDVLLRAFLICGGTISENEEVTHIAACDNCACGIETASGACHPGDVIINATGAWANSLMEGPVVRPIKGQLLNLRMADNLAIRQMIRTPRIYLAPKADGTVRIGATSEDVGFDLRITAGAVHELLQGACEAIPAAAEWTLETCLAGLRPASNDHLPSIGRGKLSGTYQAIGHGRSGFLLAPYTAYLLKQTILEGSYAYPL